jgi:hypothetical protein
VSVPDDACLTPISGTAHYLTAGTYCTSLTQRMANPTARPWAQKTGNQRHHGTSRVTPRTGTANRYGTQEMSTCEQAVIDQLKRKKDTQREAGPGKVGPHYNSATTGASPSLDGAFADDACSDSELYRFTPLLQAARTNSEHPPSIGICFTCGATPDK